MSDRLTASGLQSSAGLFGQCGVYEFDLNGSIFNPQDLNPYLLFDAETSMIGTLENPTLDLDPSKQETLDVITATRAGSATFVNILGEIETAQANTVRVDQTQGAELTPTKFQRIGYTDFANSYWNARGFTKVGTVAGPLGYTGYEFLENNTNSNPAILPNTDLSDGSPITFSVWLKASSPISIALATQGSNKSATINITTEWQFFQCTDSTNGGSGPHIGGFATITQDSGVTLFASMPQLEEGTTASDFVANTTGSAKFITGATFGPRSAMILVEPSATNFITNSNSNNLNFAFDNVSMTYNVTGSPDGETNGILFEQTGNNLSNSAYNYGLPTTDGNYSYSIFLKAAGSTKIRFRSDNGTVLVQDFNPQTMTSGTLAGNLNLKFEDYGNGWFRVSFTRTLSSAPYNRLQIYPDRINTQQGVYIFGLQVESGSTVATSYIPTSGSTVQRAADDLVISGSAFSDFYNASEGTVYTEAVGRGYFDFNSVFAISNNTFNESIYQRTPSNNQVLVVIDGGNVQASLSSPTTPTGTLVRRAVSFKLNNFKGSHDGVDTNSDTSGTIPTVDRLHIGASASGDNKLNGHIKRLLLWPVSSERL
jgi:hypothetical protein